jgi:two-component system LytT family sensor kinase
MVVRVLRYWVIAGLMATAMTLFTAFQTRLQFVLRGQEMAYFDSVVWSGVIWYIWALLAPLAIILTMRYPIEKGRLVRAVALQIVLAVGFIGLHATIAAAVMHVYPERFGILPEFGPAILQLLAMQGHWGFLSYVALVAMVHVGIYSRRAQTEALAREELRTQAASAQLTALARQMQPHFLFNALNALVAMLEEGSTAQVFTIRLAQMLRILLQSGDRATATLGEELALVEAYLEIERARLGSRLRTEIQVSPAVTECRLPAFILQPLVENAITHGIARTLEGGQIQVRAQRDAGDVVIDISNSCSSPSASQEPADGMQLTIPNCRRRLALMYGPQARFEAGFVTRNLFRASIILPLDSSALAPPT